MAEVVAGTALHVPYCFSFMRRGKAPSAKTEEGKDAAAGDKTTEPPAVVLPPSPYENSIKTICSVSTVEEFWQVYNYMRRPNDLPTTTDYHFFRDGIKPTWEDSANAKGGKLIVRLPKGLASRYWEEVVLALIGGQFHGVPDGEICGLVISIRYSEDILGIWNKTSNNPEIQDRLRDAARKVLQLPHYASAEYKPHKTSIADRSSFRNASKWQSTSNNRKTSSSGSDARHRSGSWGEHNNNQERGGNNSGGGGYNHKGTHHHGGQGGGGHGRHRESERAWR